MEDIKTAGTTAEDSGQDTGREAAPYEGSQRVALVDGQVRLLDEKGEPAGRDEIEADDAAEAAGDEAKADPGDGGEGTPDRGQAVYTPEELRATDFEKLDPGRIPPELAPWYKSMQAGFTRKTQELAESARAVRELAEELRRKPAGEEPAAIDAKEFYARKDMFLRTQVAGLFGLEPASLPENSSEWPDALRLAYRDADEQLTAGARAKYEAQRQAAAQRETAQGILAELRGADPEAYEYIRAKVDGGEISVKDEKAIAAALLKGDRETVKKYYDRYKTEYVANKHGIRTGEQPAEKAAPVKVEGTGAGGRAEEKGLPNYGELGKLKSFDEKLAWLRRHNIKP